MNRLCKFLETNNLISSSQHGFRRNRSTESAVLQFVSNIYQHLDKKLFVAGVFIDLSKAFDTLNHDILLDKLENIGVRGVPLELFKSYLTNRSQSVYCNFTCSHYKYLRKGVPQGSILGPILFIIYINDMPQASPNLNFVIYADDTSVLLSDKNINVLHTNLNTELDLLNKWIKANKLIINVTKTTYILFQNRSLKYDMPPLTMDNKFMQRVSHTKFLGLHIDEHLNWGQHINSIYLKISKLCGVLYRIRHQLTNEAMITIYYTLCYPHFMYCVSVWGGTWPSYLHQLTVAQNKLLRCMFFKGKFDSVNMLYSTHKILKFTNVHKYFLLLCIFKNVTTASNVTLFTIATSRHVTRSSGLDLMCPQYRTTLYKNSIMYSGPQYWNSLPANIKTLINHSTISTFKNTTKKYLHTLQIV